MLRVWTVDAHDSYASLRAMAIGRRQLIVHGSQLGIAASVVGISGCAPKVAATTAPAPQEGIVTLVLADYPGLEAPGSWVALQVPGLEEEVVLIHAGDGFHCVSRKCTHMGCKVGYDPEARHIKCPCHGSEYTLDGDNKKGPAKEPLRQYEARLAGANVEIVVA